MAPTQNFFLKVDAARREIKARPDIQILMNQASAYRLSFLHRTDKSCISGNEIKAPAPVANSALTVIKAPTLEGTELWLLHQSDLPALCELSGMHQADVVASFTAEESQSVLKQLQWSQDPIRLPDDRNSYLIGSPA